jgi:hypothetical protein
MSYGIHPVCKEAGLLLWMLADNMHCYDIQRSIGHCNNPHFYGNLKRFNLG